MVLREEIRNRYLGQPCPRDSMRRTARAQPGALVRAKRAFLEPRRPGRCGREQIVQRLARPWQGLPGQPGQRGQPSNVQQAPF
jgi:hypothetical protein